MTKRALTIGLICSLLGQPLFAGGDELSKEEKQARDKAADEKIKAFRKEIRKVKLAAEQCRLISILAEVQHPKILAMLAPWLGEGTAEVRATVADEIGKYHKDKTAATALLNAVKPNLNNKDVILRIIKAVAAVDCDQTVPAIHQLFGHKEMDVAAEAIAAAGTMKHISSIEQLIRSLRDLEAMKAEVDDYRQKNPGGMPPGFNPGTPGGAPPQLDDEAKMQEKESRVNTLTKPVKEALKAITGEWHETSKEWEVWWVKNRKTFKIEEEEKKK